MITIPTARDFIRQISPPWLAGGWAERLLYALAIQVDAFSDALIAGVQLRFPNYYSAASLPLLGRERRIGRGLIESDASYAVRLRRWLDDHRVRGGPYAMLRQLREFYVPEMVSADLIYHSGRFFHLAQDGTISTGEITWHPDTYPTRWAAWWLFLWTDVFTPPLSADALTALRLVPAEWNAAHAQGHILLLGADGELWNFPLGRAWNRPRVWNYLPNTRAAVE